MKLLMFREANGRRLGVALEGAVDRVVDVAELARATGSPSPPADLLALVQEGPAGLQRLGTLLAKVDRSAAEPIIRRLSALQLLAPLDPPVGNILAVGRNYQKHAEEGARAQGTEVKPPTFFTKAITSVAGPNDEIRIDPAVSDKIDWEVELGVVIGRGGVNIQRADALGHVFGYTVINDVSARDIQNGWGGQFFKGKSLDGSCPSGPWVVTADEVPDPQALRLRLLVNGEVKQDATTADMIYPVDEVIRWLSIGMTLLPGMLIATGTPEGVGFARQPPEFLKPGDLMESEVAGVGKLSNRCVEAGSPVPAG
ncbi:MAG TPA: fumarylacetoacetate hydrolase family protein [Candidatus Dormibacteraeota bacterium]|jgi:2-keto-4-pentenoate hydratase/2-oxohepta-3-ene-1,7-dioic acid hydratase in catechol pathway